MSETKFTKGDWQVFRVGISVGCEKHQGIAELWREGDERKANADLIACAPEMYAMLEVAAKQLSHSPIGYRINKLLAKARGEA